MVDICQSAVLRDVADVSAAAMGHAAGLFLKEMGYNLCDSFSINTGGWFTASPHIRGVFDTFVFGRPSFIFCFKKQIRVSATLNDD